MMDRFKEMMQNDDEPCKEAQVAAEWWADILRENDVQHDNGDAMQSALAQTVREKTNPDEFDPEKVDEFEDLVAEKIQGLIEERLTWDYTEPEMGSTYIRCDYHAHQVLADSAEEAGIEISSMTTFPIKTSVWVDPGCVKVSKGYQAEQEVIWEIGDHYHELKEIADQWDFDTRIEPIKGGYHVFGYRENEDKLGGRERKQWDMWNETIGEHGVEPAMEQLRFEIERWRKE